MGYDGGGLSLLLLALKMQKDSTDQGTWAPEEAEKGKGPDSPRVSRRNHPCPHLDFSPVKPMLDF